MFFSSLEKLLTRSFGKDSLPEINLESPRWNASSKFYFLGASQCRVSISVGAMHQDRIDLGMETNSASRHSSAETGQVGQIHKEFIDECFSIPYLHALTCRNQGWLLF